MWSIQAKLLGTATFLAASGRSEAIRQWDDWRGFLFRWIGCYSRVAEGVYDGRGFSGETTEDANQSIYLDGGVCRCWFWLGCGCGDWAGLDTRCGLENSDWAAAGQSGWAQAGAGDQHR